MALLDFELGPEASKNIWTEVSRTNAITKLSTRIVLPGNGSAIPVIGKATAGWVGRGEAKPVSNLPASTNVIQPYEVATIIAVSDDLVEDHAGLLEAVQTEGISAISDTINQTIMGTVPAPGENFATFDATDIVVVNDRASFYQALKAASTPRKADGILITSALLWDLLAETVSTTNNGVFNITDSTINGVPYAVVESTESKAVMGPFASGSRWGYVGGIHVKVSDEASFVENTNTVSAFQNDLVAVRVKARFGFQVANEDNFVQFGDDAAGPVAS